MSPPDRIDSSGLIESREELDSTPIEIIQKPFAVRLMKSPDWADKSV
jgi:hypothetical protein